MELHAEPEKTSIPLDNADFWGATAQGKIGRIRAHREVTMRKMALVVAILKQSVTTRVWVAVIGLVVYVSLYARPALSFLETVFHESDGYAPGAVIVPGRRALAELGAWLAFVPFISVDLRATYDSRVSATDASSRSRAAVFTQMPEGLVREIWRHRPHRGIGQRYCDTVVADDANVSAESDVAGL